MLKTHFYRNLIAGAALLVSLPVLSQSEENLKLESKMAIKQLANELKSNLKGAIDSHGLMGAIDFCNARALPITAILNENSQSKVARTSLKVRNSKNAPSDWQQSVLHNFEKQMLNGTDINELEFSEIVNSPSGSEFRFMKAIPTGKPCLHCHGKEIKPELASKIKQLYPNDQATNFELGSIRGAFVVTRKIDN